MRGKTSRNIADALHLIFGPLVAYGPSKPMGSPLVRDRPERI
jgi:hypothetical protein